MEESKTRYFPTNFFHIPKPVFTVEQIGWECDEEAELAYSLLKSTMVSAHQSSLPLTIWILHPAPLTGSLVAGSWNARSLSVCPNPSPNTMSAGRLCLISAGVNPADTCLLSQHFPARAGCSNTCRASPCLPPTHPQPSRLAGGDV